MSNIYYANIINPNLLQSSVLDPISNPMSSNLDLGMNEIVNVGEASQPNSAVNLGQINEIVASMSAGGSSFSGNATFDINMNNHNITNVNELTFNDGSNILTTPHNSIYTNPVVSNYGTSGTNIQVHPLNPNTINFDSAGSIGIGGSFYGSSFRLLPNIICNDDSTNLCVSKDGGVTLGKIYDSHYNLPPTNITGINSITSTDNSLVVTTTGQTSNIEFSSDLTKDMNCNNHGINNTNGVTMNDAMGTTAPFLLYNKGGILSYLSNNDQGLAGNVYDDKYNIPPSSGSGFSGDVTFDINMNNHNITNTTTITTATAQCNSVLFQDTSNVPMTWLYTDGGIHTLKVSQAPGQFGYLYDSLYNTPSVLSIKELGQDTDLNLTYNGDTVLTSGKPYLVETNKVTTQTLGSAGGYIGASGSTYTYVASTTIQGKFSDVFSKTQGYKIHFDLPIGAPIVFPFTNQNPTMLKIQIVDNNNNSIIENVTDIITFKNNGFTYTNQTLSFDYFFNPETPTIVNNYTNAFYTGNFNNVNPNLVQYFTFKFYLYSLSNGNFPFANRCDGTMIVYNSDSSFNYPVISKYNNNGTTTISLGNNLEPNFTATSTDIYYGGNKIVCAPHLNIGTFSRKFTGSPSTPDNFFIPVGINTCGYVKITLTGHAYGINQTGWGTYEVTGYFNNTTVTQSSPYVASNSGQIIHGSDSNGDANSCVFSSAVLSMSLANPNQISVMVALHSTSVVYTAKYEIIDCVGVTY